MSDKQTLTDIIMKSTSPWDNPYQGRDKKILFVCSAGILRSATAARIYADKYNTRACGSLSYALIPISGDLLAWADEIVFMNPENYIEADHKFDLESVKESKKVTTLNIPDMYPHMHTDLIRIIKEQYNPEDTNE